MRFLVILESRWPSNSSDTVKDFHLYVKIKIYVSRSFYFSIKDSLGAPFDGNLCLDRSISAGLCNFPNSTAIEIAVFCYAKTPILGNTLIDNWNLRTDTVSFLSPSEN